MQHRAELLLRTDHKISSTIDFPHLGECEGVVDVGGEDASGEAICGVVSAADKLLHAGEPDNDHDDDDDP